jgi:hypothetical protein
LTGVPHEILQELELLGLQVDGLTCPRRVTFEKVNLQFADADLGLGRGKMRPTGEASIRAISSVMAKGLTS